MTKFINESDFFLAQQAIEILSTLLVINPKSVTEPNKFIN